jgi:hypothetical protein
MSSDANTILLNNTGTYIIGANTRTLVNYNTDLFFYIPVKKPIEKPVDPNVYIPIEQTDNIPIQEININQ